MKQLQIEQQSLPQQERKEKLNSFLTLSNYKTDLVWQIEFMEGKEAEAES